MSCDKANKNKNKFDISSTYLIKYLLEMGDDETYNTYFYLAPELETALPERLTNKKLEGFFTAKKKIFELPSDWKNIMIPSFASD